MEYESNLTAGATVCNIPELLEMILVKVDMKTLLLSERTCKAFQFTIAESQKLQIKLFMRVDEKAAKGRRNPLLKIAKPLVDAEGRYFSVYNRGSKFIVERWKDGNWEPSTTGSWQKMYAM